VATGDVEEAVESIRRLKAIAGEKGYRVIPGHDPEVWPAFTAEMGVAGPTGPGRFLAAGPAAPVEAREGAGTRAAAEAAW
jgi:glyoxylase-like metal-dependent hydrolase (beta-lactamase superfamily II)